MPVLVSSAHLIINSFGVPFHILTENDGAGNIVCIDAPIHKNDKSFTASFPSFV